MQNNTEKCCDKKPSLTINSNKENCRSYSVYSKTLKPLICMLISLFIATHQVHMTRRLKW